MTVCLHLYRWSSFSSTFCHVLTQTTPRGGCCVFTGKLFTIYGDLRAFLYANECGSARDIHLECWDLSMAIAYNYFSTCSKNSLSCVHMIWVGVVYKCTTCFTHALINETRGVYPSGAVHLGRWEKSGADQTVPKRFQVNCSYHLITPRKRFEPLLWVIGDSHCRSFKLINWAARIKWSHRTEL